ncbi:MAG TPA: hypothetical protein VF043_35750 [Ktedonobacteraceae bacterium]
MITCSRCGKSVHAGSTFCPGCGTPLTNMSRGGADTGTGPSEQPGLPAWLESLRSSEQPDGASSGDEQGFSATDFFDEGTVPAWMRPENSDISDPGNSGKYPAFRPASMPAPNTDSEFLSPGGFSASSLIDEQALPPWLQGKPAEANQSMPTNISASSLVQPDALPEWIRNMPQSQQPSGNQSSAPASNIPYPVQNNQAGMIYQAPAPQSFQAHELIDQQALPPWLGGLTNSSAPANQASQQAGPPYNYSAPAPIPPGQANLPSGIGASSLLDMNSLPAWLRESEQGQGQDTPPAHPGQPANSNNSGGNLTGASLIDMNSLPGWLRSSEEGHGTQQGSMGNSRPAPFGTTPRGENVRVPSRPRAEIGPYDSSEVAANVFSSMLGVASSAPYYPSGSQQGQPQMRPMPAPPPNAPGSMPQMSNDAPGMQSGFSGQGYSMGNQPGASGQQLATNRAGMQSFSPGSGQRANPNSSATKPARRGIIDTIRSWFSIKER